MTDKQLGVAKLLCLLTIVVAVLDQNIVSSAIVPIVRELDPAGGLDHVAWLVTAFALGATSVLPLYGRLCDALGVKQVFLGAVGTFALGSLLCGLAQSMGQLIAFRAVQGIGAGGLMSVTMVVMAHLRRPGDKSGPGATAGLVAGIGFAVGPLLGGLFADHGDWRLAFLVNLPITALIIGGALWAVRIPRHAARGSVDVAGAALAAAFACSLLLVCDWGGTEYAWTSPMILGLAAAAIVSLALFLRRQATAAHPILPLSLFRVAALRGAFLVQALCSVAMVGTMVYLMLYLQVARGVTATGAAGYLVFMALGLTASGFLGRDASVRVSLVAGTGATALALAWLAFLRPDTSLWLVRAALMLVGLGFGQLLGKLIMLVQQQAPAAHLGVATTGIRWFQNLGMAVGSAVLGSLLARVLAARTGGLDISGVATHPEAVGAFVSSLGVVFAVAAAVMTAALVCAARLRETDRRPEPLKEPAAVA
ncbi:MFS transporter [Nonomuraea roseoviolacea]|uniref:MFS family permease n=1 Tax=Nonomuraea roseoviolacea subsp. carminata TaxID=160689 RepID=A0ABT1JUY1_9ACTN|nr:MFS transporter [Nonomuraea roseoviolacea]MCP2345553.1 MFS family permease [Nonomuraea roseoviolacea subsp. carminata]